MNANVSMQAVVLRIGQADVILRLEDAMYGGTYICAKPDNLKQNKFYLSNADRSQGEEDALLAHYAARLIHYAVTGQEPFKHTTPIADEKGTERVVRAINLLLMARLNQMDDEGVETEGA